MIKKRSYEIKKIRLRDINSEYIKSLNISNYLRFKKKHTLNTQTKYLKKINNSRNNFIESFIKKLVGTMNTQIYGRFTIVVKNLKILYLSEYLFLTNTKKIGKFSIKNFSSFLIKRYDHIFSTINKKNLISINVFKNAGFKNEI